MLWPGREIEVNLVLFNFSLVSDMQSMSTLNCSMLGVCIILHSEKAEMRCLNEKMKDCYLNQT